jgi:hypothetical protein
VNVIGHDDKFVDVTAGIMSGNFIPNGLNHDPRVIQPHYTVNDLSEQAFPVIGANGYEICA